MTRKIFLGAATIAAIWALSPAAMWAQPSPPATFTGSASVGGKPAPDGTDIHAFINGLDCTQPGGNGTLSDGSTARYRIEVLAAAQLTGCGTDGAAVTFTVGGNQADETAKWQPGPQVLNLTASKATPTTAPTSPTATASAPATPPASPSPSAAAAQVSPTASPPPLVRVGSGTPETAHLTADAASTAHHRSDNGARNIAITAAGVAVVAGAIAAGLARRRALYKKQKSPQ